ncbi:MAG: HipA N-terminal domain-containing protein [bacterium]
MNGNNFRKAQVFYDDKLAGIIEEIDEGYRFTYNDEFLKKKISISLSLPHKEKIHQSKELFPFFEGLIAEGWFLKVICSTLKVDENDKFGILIKSCSDCIGAVSVKEFD